MTFICLKINKELDLAAITVVQAAHKCRMSCKLLSHKGVMGEDTRRD